MSYNDKSNKEILVEIKKLELDHENIKTKLVSLLNELETIEKNYLIATNELKKRGVK